MKVSKDDKPATKIIGTQFAKTDAKLLKIINRKLSRFKLLTQTNTHSFTFFYFLTVFVSFLL